MIRNRILATSSSQVNAVLGPKRPNATKVVNSNGHITINAQAGNDRIRIRQVGFRLEVLINNREQVDVDVRIAGSITIQAGKGSDEITVEGNVEYPLILNAGRFQNNDVDRITTPTRLIDPLDSGNNYYIPPWLEKTSHFVSSSLREWRNYRQVILGR